jgi:hypothetical protein
MDRSELERLLHEVKRDALSVEDALDHLARLPLRDLGHSVVDTHRELRCGFPEAIFAEGKSPDELVEVARTVVEAHGRVLATRVRPEGVAALGAAFPDATVHERSRAVTIDRRPDPGRGTGRVLVVSAGTSDAPVAEEAAVTARMCGAAVETLSDVGVAGIHRLLASADRLRAARVLVVVAGMEGALASVVGGLVDRPVIAVPTSVGYGAAFGGLAALLAMLNSCAAGVTVVNIDNGFGAGYAAALVNRSSPPSEE